MGFLKNLFAGGETVKGIADGVSGIIETTANVIRNEHPELDADLAKAQIELNKIEAASPSLFVAGWRPFIGWTCGGALAWNFVIRPLASAIFKAELPPIDMSQLYPLIIALLGLGTMRTAEKIRKVQSNH